MNEVSDPFLPPAHKSLSQVWFLRGYRAGGLAWISGVVLHDSGLYENSIHFACVDIQINSISIWSKSWRRKDSLRLRS